MPALCEHQMGRIFTLNGSQMGSMSKYWSQMGPMLEHGEQIYAPCGNMGPKLAPYGNMGPKLAPCLNMGAHGIQVGIHLSIDSWAQCPLVSNVPSLPQ